MMTARERESMNSFLTSGLGTLHDMSNPKISNQQLVWLPDNLHANRYLFATNNPLITVAPCPRHVGFVSAAEKGVVNLFGPCFTQDGCDCVGNLYCDGGKCKGAVRTVVCSF